MVSVNDQYTIGQLARDADVPVSTVRYYERRHLMRANARSGGNYRLYDQESLNRLRFVRSAQAAGFTLTDVRSLLDYRDGELEPCCKVQALIETRLLRVREEQARLHAVEDLLGRWLRNCQSARRSRNCGVLELLDATGGRGRRRRSPKGA